jgi:predicted SAM-dependent methyltransferase
VKLNLGCGHKLLKGFVNVDLADNWASVQPDVVADVTQRLPFDDGAAEEVHAYHVIEHVWRWQTEATLKEWCRVLAPGGMLVLELPCLEKVMAYMLSCLQNDQPLQNHMSLWAMYGDPNYQSVEMSHKWLYGRRELKDLLRDQGLVDVRSEPPQTHIALRDMRIVGRKP